MSDLGDIAGPSGGSWYQSGHTRTVSALFENRADAERAVGQLKAEGISAEEIRMVSGREDEMRSGSAEDENEGGGFWETLSEFFFPEEDRSSYAEGLKRGGYLVTVQTDAGHHDRVVEILNTEGVIDLDEREESWRAEGWSASSASSGMESGPSRAEGEEVIPVAEEELRIGRRQVAAGSVRVRSYVVETPVNETVRLRREHVDVSRRPADRAVDAGDDAFRERTIEARETEEEPVISKQARVKEEVVVKKHTDTQEENVSDTLRKTEVEVEDDRSKGGSGSSSGT